MSSGNYAVDSGDLTDNNAGTEHEPAYAAFTDLPPEQQSHCDAGFVEHCRDEIVELLELPPSMWDASIKLEKLRERLHYYRRGFVATCNNSAARGDPLPGTFTSWRKLAASRRVGPVVEDEDPEPFTGLWVCLTTASRSRTLPRWPCPSRPVTQPRRSRR